MSIWRWGRTKDPELQAALEARQAADKALAEYDRGLKKKYGRNIPSDAPERRESDRLEQVAWEKLQIVQSITAQLKQQRQAEKDARSWERFERWTTAIDSTVAKYRLTQWSRMTEQERWDSHNIEMNEDHAKSQARLARIAERFGLKGVAEKARKEADSRTWMAERAERCPNNPRNGGDGFGRAGFRNGRNWTERRRPDWEYVEDYEERRARGGVGFPWVNSEAPPDPLVTDRDDESDPPPGPFFLDAPPTEWMDCPDCDRRGCETCGGDGLVPTWLKDPDVVGESTARSWGWNGRRDRTWDGSPETPAETRFFDLRESGYTGWIDESGYAVACPSCGDKDCTKGLTEHHNNGGQAMTAPATPTATGDVVSIADLRAVYEQTGPAMAGVAEQQSAAAAGFRAQAAAYEAAVGGLTSEGHDPQTIAEAAAAMEAMHEAARLADAAAAAADNAQATIGAALQGLERHRALEEAVASHAGPARSTDAYAPR